MLNTRGFTFIESLVAFTILMTTVTTVFPIIALVSTEQAILSDRRDISLRLHDELQLYIRQDDRPLPAEYTKSHSVRDVTYSFFMDAGFIKGCAEWKNAKHKEEIYCIYGIKEK
ncbi:type II secretion system protein [Virgibacillus xinjiangensis]|uniref:Type II secretion system protein n=1 Tax=Virgibacillus xinjiangensis TaxID=393090 RepID=A0ABV7CRM3_9BACI